MCCSHFVVNALINFLKCLFVVGFNAGLVAYQAWIDTIKLLAVSLLSWCACVFFIADVLFSMVACTFRELMTREVIHFVFCILHFEFEFFCGKRVSEHWSCLRLSVSAKAGPVGRIKLTSAASLFSVFVMIVAGHATRQPMGVWESGSVKVS